MRQIASKRSMWRLGNKGTCALQCTKVSKSKTFQNAIAIQAPVMGDYVYLNKKYQNKSLDELYSKTKGLQGLLVSDVSSM